MEEIIKSVLESLNITTKPTVPRDTTDEDDSLEDDFWFRVQE